MHRPKQGRTLPFHFTTKAPAMKKRHIVHILLWVGLGLLLSDLIYRHGIELLKVPTSSMEPTIHTGEFVLVNKFIPGPRYLVNDPDRYNRLFQTHPLQYNDIIVFNFPEADTIVPHKPGESYYLLRRQHPGLDTLLTSEHWGELQALEVNQRPRMIKRIAALPGDTLQIIRGQLHLNGHLQISPKQANDTLQPLAPGIPDPYVFPSSNNHRWNADNLGPFYLPRKGDAIALTPDTYPLYSRIIRVFEGVNLEQRGSFFYLNNRPIKRYTFKMNYYWVHGDNRPRSFDSRYWGPVPENHIVGVVKHR